MTGARAAHVLRDLAGAIDERHLRAQFLAACGRTWVLDDVAAAEPTFEHVAGEMQALGDRSAEADAAYSLAELRVWRDDLPGAARFFGGVLALCGDGDRCAARGPARVSARASCSRGRPTGPSA